MPNHPKSEKDLCYIRTSNAPPPQSRGVLREGEAVPTARLPKAAWVHWVGTSQLSLWKPKPSRLLVSKSLALMIAPRRLFTRRYSTTDLRLGSVRTATAANAASEEPVWHLTGATVRAYWRGPSRGLWALMLAHKSTSSSDFSLIWSVRTAGTAKKTPVGVPLLAATLLGHREYSWLGCFLL